MALVEKGKVKLIENAAGANRNRIAFHKFYPFKLIENAAGANRNR
jgi:hypothetical protein